MARVLTAEETRNDYIAAMGPDLAPLFYALYNETTSIHRRWHQFIILFGTRPERVQMINAAAGLFFRVVQDSFWGDTLLHLSRITDRASTGGKSNLTIRRLPELVNDPGLTENLEQLVSHAIEKTSFARDWRNRRIAHSDFELATDSGAEALAPANRDSVEAALKAIVAVLNCLELHYKEGTLYFESLREPGDAEALLYVIRDGLEIEATRRRRAREGRGHEDDQRLPPAV